MGKRTVSEKDRANYQKLFNENKELRHELAKITNQLARSKRPCKCEKPSKEPKEEKKSNKKQEVVLDEPTTQKCPTCGDQMFKVEYTKMGEDWCFFQCVKDKKHRTTGKKDV